MHPGNVDWRREQPFAVIAVRNSHTAAQRDPPKWSADFGISPRRVDELPGSDRAPHFGECRGVLRWIGA